MQYVDKLTGGKPIHAVLGGMHLIEASPDRLARTIESLRSWNILRPLPSVAKRFARCQLGLLDLIQAGNAGLMRAVEKFDLRRGCRFCIDSYASGTGDHFGQCRPA